MKPNHATAIALVGWFLMVPLVQIGKPVESNSPPAVGGKTKESNCGQTHYITFDARIDPEAPLSKWSMLYYSDSLRDCEAFLDNLKSKAKSDATRTGRDGKKIGMRQLENDNEALSANERCIAGDDPRLKGNEQIREVQLMTPESRAQLFGQMERELKTDRPNGK